MHLKAAAACVGLTCACFGNDASPDARKRAAERGPEVATSQVEQRDGVFVLRGAREPFTGRIVAFDPHTHFDYTDVFDGVEVFADGDFVEIPDPPAWPEASADSVYARALRDHVAAHGHCHTTLLLYRAFASDQDVPSLLSELKKLDVPHPSGGVVCCHGHCIEALEHAAGGSKGTTYAEWAEWWGSAEGFWQVGCQ